MRSTLEVSSKVLFPFGMMNYTNRGSMVDAADDVTRVLEELPESAERQYVETELWSGLVALDFDMVNAAIEQGNLSAGTEVDLDGVFTIEADNFSASDAMETKCAAELQAFWAFLPPAIRLKLVAFTPEFDPTQFAHDYALTRNGHGAGFWDRDSKIYGGEEIQAYLTEWSRTMGETNLYLNSDLEVEIDS